jgi:hypothetical protein
MRLALLLLATSALAEPKLDSTTALAAAKQRGLKQTMILPEPIACPTLPTATIDPKLRATGELAPFVLSIDTFLRDDFEVPQAIALLGENVLCGRSISTFRDYHLAPRDTHIHAVSLELYDDKLIGVVIELDSAVTLDVAKLSKKYGPMRKVPGIHRANEGVTIRAETPAFRANLYFDNTDTKVRRVIFRRTPMIEILPEKFQTAADLARLVNLALRPNAPEPVRFFGTLGVFDKEHSTPDRDAMLPAIAMRNVAKASIDHVARGERRAVQSIDVTFAKPITGNLAKALGAKPVKPGATIEVPGGTVEFDGLHLVIRR